MKAWIYRRHGGADVLELAEIAKPAPRRGEIRIAVAAFALNPLDWKLRAGQFRIMTRGGLPRGVGYDVAGTVDECGPGTAFRPGDRVVAMLNPYASTLGAAAEYTCAVEKHTAAIPGPVDFVAAASLPGSGLTALQTLRKSQLAAGQRALILGASGGVGSFATLLAKRAGAHVTAAASTAGQAQLALLQPDRAIDSTGRKWRSLGEQFDLVFDCSGATTFAECRPLLNETGVYANTLPNGAMYRDAFVAWLTSRQRVIPVMERPIRADVEHLLALVADGSLRPPVTRIGAMADVPELERLLEAGQGRGKFVVRVADAAR